MSCSDIITLSEHWLHNNRLSQFSEISLDFNFCARASKESSEEEYGIHRGQGGVAILWRKTLKGVSSIETIKHDRICGVRVQVADGAVLVILSVYLPAAGSKTCLKVTIDELEGILETIEDNAIPIICGDFNGHMGVRGGPRGKGMPTKAGKIVCDFMDRQNLFALNLMRGATGSLPTYIGHNGSSTIDYIMAPKFFSKYVVKVYTGGFTALNTSDHIPVRADFNIDMIPQVVELEDSPKRVKWDKFTAQEMAELYQVPIYEALRGVVWDIGEPPGNHDQIDALIDLLVNTLTTADKVIPRSKYKKHLKPYWTAELKELKREKMHWFRIWKEGGRSTDNNDPVRIQMKRSKNLFAKRLRAISKQYENQSIAEAANLAEVDRDQFWRLFRRTSKPNSSVTHAVKDSTGKVMYEINDILEVWRRHFDLLSNPRQSDNFDNAHFQTVTDAVRGWVDEGDLSEFLEVDLSIAEVGDAIRKLNLAKAPGFDGITTEHVRYAGDAIIQPLCTLFNGCIRSEYVPCNFRRGIQVPLYKGKNTCSLDPDNYRGITLLTTFNKLFEVLIWSRIKRWWFDERIVSDLQGATRAGSSCIHTALTLQETISKEREGNRNVFVSYYDVSKAFDSVWIDGLFYQMYRLGIRGSLWRILYKSYVDFNCCVRIGSHKSDWYAMKCGIHQGGYLSLVKYTAFINSLITSLETSGLCSAIYRIPTSPVGYADDVAACTVSKRRMDGVMEVVYTHGNTWRYSFNAKKSAVLVFGETQRERNLGVANRAFMLGPDKVKEKLYYDHVGIKTCVLGDSHIRTDEKISKARKVLNMSSSLGIKRGGLNLSTINLIYWTVIIPILCFGCEIWVIKRKDEALLSAFQRYAARRLQRFHTRSVNITSYICLGWMSIVNYIKGRQIMFLRSIVVMKDNMPIRKIMEHRVNEFDVGNGKPYDSPLLHTLQICHELELLDTVREMLRGNVPSKAMWRRLVWDKVWAMENEWWSNKMAEDRHLSLFKQVSEAPAYSIWWQIADVDRSYMKQCEVMVRILCHCTVLKDDDFRLKRATIWDKMCTLCDLAAIEDARHMIMQCPYHTDLRVKLQDKISRICPDFGTREVFKTILGKPIEGIDAQNMCRIWKIGCEYTARMYWATLRVRQQ